MSLSGGYLLSFQMGVLVFLVAAAFFVGRELNKFFRMDSEEQREYLGVFTKCRYHTMNTISFGVFVAIPTAVWYCIIYALQAVAIVHSLPTCK